MGNIVLSSIPPLLGAAVFTSFGFSVFFTKNKKRNKIIFGFLCMSTALWQWSWFVLFNTSDITVAEEIAVSGHIAILVLPALLYNLAFRLNETYRPKEWMLMYAVWIATLILEVVLVTTNYIIDGVYTYSWGFYPKAGEFHWVFIVLAALTMTGTVATLLRDHKKAVSYFRKEQIKYVLIGLLFFNMAWIDFLTNYGLDLYPLGFVFLFFFLICIWYAITQHHFLQISDVLKKSLLLSLLAVYTWVAFAFMNHVYPALENSLWLAPLYTELSLIFIFVLIASSLVESLSVYMDKAMERYINPARVVKGILSEISETNSLPLAGKIIGENLEHVIDASVSISLQITEKNYVEIYRSSDETSSGSIFAPESLTANTTEFVKSSREFFTANDLKFSPLPDGQQAEIARELKLTNVAAIIPMHDGEVRLGYILLSNKNDHSQYTTREREILQILLPTISQEIKRLNN